MPTNTIDRSVEPLVVRPAQARAMLGGCSNDELNRKIQNGELESFLDGRRRLIVVASIKADIARKVAAAAKSGFQHASGSRVRKAADGVGFEHAKKEPGASNAGPQ
jgi:hypothetical protein